RSRIAGGRRLTHPHPESSARGPQISIEPTKRFPRQLRHGYEVAAIAGIAGEIGTFRNIVCFLVRPEQVEQRLRVRLQWEDLIVSRVDDQHRHMDPRRKVERVGLFAYHPGRKARDIEHGYLETRLDGKQVCGPNATPAVAEVAEIPASDVGSCFEVVERPPEIFSHMGQVG